MDAENVRAAFITPIFSPETAGPPVLIARALQHAGFDTAVLTTVPNYPLGRTFPGYSSWKPVTETSAGFRVARAPVFPSHDSAVFRRFGTYGSFAASASAIGHGMLLTADVALVYATQITAALPAMIARYSGGPPYVLMIQDLWPDSIFATGFLDRGPARKLTQIGLGGFAQAAYAGAEHIIVIAPGMRDRLVERGVPASRISVIYNWADEAVTRPMAPTGRLRSQLGLASDDFIFLYAGNHGYAQRLDTWVNAMSQVEDLKRVHLVLMGQGSEREGLARLVAERGLPNVHLLEAVPREEVSEISADADALVISLADEPLFQITLPGKTQASLALGKPIVASGAGDLRRVIEKSGAGWVVPPESPDAVARAIRLALTESSEGLANRGLSGLSFYRRCMSQAIGEQAISEVLRAALRPQGGHQLRPSVGPGRGLHRYRVNGRHRGTLWR